MRSLARAACPRGLLRRSPREDDADPSHYTRIKLYKEFRKRKTNPKTSVQVRRCSGTSKPRRFNNVYGFFPQSNARAQSEGPQNRNFPWASKFQWGHTINKYIYTERLPGTNDKLPIVQIQYQSQTIKTSAVLSGICIYILNLDRIWLVILR